MRRLSAHCSIAAWGIALCWLASTQQAWAQEPTGRDILLRNVYVPAHETTAWPTQGAAYVPVDADRFAELLRVAGRDSLTSSPANAERLVLYGSLDATGRVDGSGAMRLTTAHGDDAWLSFPAGPSSVMGAAWRSTGTSAQLGYWGGDRQLALRVPADDWLDFSWQALSVGGASPLNEYRLAMPPALSTVLYLDLPVGQTPQAIHGTVEPAAESGEGQKIPLAAPLPPVAPDKVRWLLKYGPQGSLGWRLPTTESNLSPLAGATYFETIDYRATRSGMRLRQAFTISAAEGLPRRLNLLLPAALVVHSASWDGAATHVEREGQQSMAVIELSEQGRKPGQHRLEIEAWHPLLSDQATSLPQASLPDVYWLSGQIHVGLSSTLQVDWMQPRSLAQLPVGKGPATRIMDFEKLSPAGRLALTVRPRATGDKLKMGSDIELLSAGANATVNSEWQSLSHPTVRVLRAKLGPGWQPNLVTAELPYSVDEWYVENLGERQALVVRVSHSADPTTEPEQPLRLVVEASLPESTTAGWQPAESYHVLDWQAADATAEVLTFSVEDGYQAEWSPPPQPLPPGEAETYQGTLLPQDPDRRVYDRAALAGNVQVLLRTAAPTVDATLVTRVADALDHWKLSHRIEYEPRRGSMERLQIALATPAPKVLRWKLEGEDVWQEELAERESKSDTGGTVREWELTLPRRRSGPFVVLIDGGMWWTTSCLPSVPRLGGIRDVQQVVQLESPKVRQLRVEASGWHLSASTTGSDPADATWIADPASGPGSLVVFRATEALDSLPLANVRWARWCSIYAPATPVRHQLSLAIDNRAEKELQCELPANAMDARWLIGSTESKWQDADLDQPARLTIPLPTRGVEEVRIAFTQPGPELADGIVVTPPDVRLSVPLGEMDWEVRFPASYQTPLASPATWQQRLFGPLAPAQSSGGDAGEATSGEDSFRQTVLRVAAGQPPALHLVHRPTRDARQCLLLAISALVGSLCWRRRHWLWMMLAWSAAAALLLPVGWYDWATAVWGGLLLAVVVRGLEAATTSLRERWPVIGSRALAGSTAVVSGVVILALVAQRTLADDAKPIIESVLIPVDGEGRVVGEERYLSPALLGELLDREQLASHRDSWVAWAPQYEGSLSAGEQAGTRSASVGRWTVAFDLEVYQSPAQVELPFRLEDAAWSSTASLDGTPVALEWSDDGRLLRFDAPRSGRFRVKIDFQPLIRSEGDRWLFRMHAPPLPGGTIAVDAPSVADRVTINAQPLPAVAATFDAAPMPLGSETEMVVAWPQQLPPTTRDAALASQWEWLQLGLHQATIDAVYEIEGPLADASELELLIDGVPAEMVDDQAASDRQWRLVSELQADHVDGLYSVVRFRLASSRDAVYGRLQLPRLRIAGTAIRLRRVATTVRDQLVVSLDSGSAADRQWFDEFASRWPDRGMPDAVASLNADEARTVATIRPAPAEVSADESLDVCCLDDRMEIVYRAAIDSGDRPLSTRRLQISPTLTVQSVQLTVGDQMVPVDFSQQDQGELLVLFAEPVTGTMELRVTGFTPLLSGELAGALVGIIPQITTSLESSSSQQLTLYAADHLTAEPVQGEVEQQLVDPPTRRPADCPAYWVGTYLTPPDRSTPLVVLVEDNPAKFTADLLTVMIRRDNAWLAEVALLVEVEQGAVPELVLDWPDSLVGDVEVEANVGVEAVLEHSGSRRLRLRLDRAVTTRERLRLTLRAAVRVDEPQRMQCPVVQVRDAERTSWYFGELQDDAGSWQWRGAKPGVAAARIEGLLAPWPAARLWQAAANDHPSGIWTAKEDSARTYRLPLATLTLHEAADERTIVETQLVVPALEVDEFNLWLPSDQQFLEAKVDGAAAWVVRGRDGTWRLQMPDPDLPHLVQLSSVAKHVLTNRPFEPPQLAVGDRVCHVDHRVWYVPDSLHAQLEASNTAERLSRANVAALRLNQLLSASVTNSGRLARQVARGWSESWIAEIRAAEAALRRALDESEDAATQIVQPEGASQEFDDLLTRTTNELLRMRGEAGLATVPLDELPMANPRAATERVRVFVQSTESPLRLASLASDGGDPLVRWSLALAGLLLATLHIARGDRWRVPLDGYELLFPVVIIVGLAWWIALSPRLLGLLLALLAIVAWLRLNRLRTLAQGSS